MQAAVFGYFSLDIAAVLFGDGSGYGKPDAEAAGFLLGAGFVASVEAVEEVIERILAQRFFHGIFGSEYDVFSRTAQRDHNVGVIGCVLDGVVAEGADEPPQCRFVAVYRQVVFNIEDQVFAVKFRHSLKRFGNIAHDVREIYRSFFKAGIRFIHPREIHKLVHQLAHIRDLFLRAVYPFVFANVHRKHVHIGGNDRQRRFQLVTRVGNKTLLLFDVVHHRFDRFFAE